MRSPRAVDLARLALGAVALARPRTVLVWSRGHDSRGSRRVVRILGARYLLQAIGGTALQRPWVPAADAGVDVVHAASMLGVAAVAPLHRRLAFTSCVVATGFAAADLYDDGSRRRPAPAKSRA